MCRKTIQAVLILILAGLNFTPPAEAACGEDRPPGCFIVSEEAARIREVNSLMNKLVQEGNIDEIVRLWQGEKWSSTRTYYRNALLRFEREKYIPAFLAVAKCNNKWSRSTAIEVLARFREPALLDYLKTLLDEKPLTAEEKKAVEAEIEKLASDDEAVREAAKAKIRKYGTRAKPVLVPYLYVKNKAQREAVCGLYHHLPDNDPGTLLSLTRRYDARDRVAFAEAVVKLEEGKYAHLGNALDVLAATKPAEYKKFCLQLIDSPNPKPSVSDTSSHAISAAIRLLANCGDPKVTPKLYPFLDLHPRYYCGDAALALAEYGDKSQIERMKAFYNRRFPVFVMNSNRLTQHGKILLALLKLGDRTIMDELFNSRLETSENAAMSIAAIAKDAASLPAIIRIINTSRNPQHAAKAMATLAQIVRKQDQKAITLVRKRITDWKADHPTMYYKGCGILMDMGDEKARRDVAADLAKAAADEKAIILRWIADTYPRSVIPFLVDALDDKSPAKYRSFRSRLPFRTLGPGKTIRELAIDGIKRIVPEMPFDLWDFDRDRQVREIKAWHKR